MNDLGSKGQNSSTVHDECSMGVQVDAQNDFANVDIMPMVQMLELYTAIDK